MSFVYYPEMERGAANYGWLKARYSFSFGSYFNRNNMHFGALRVLNDDEIDAGMGFEPHSHEDMEIITIPLAGAISHKDSLGNIETVSLGQVQIMTAGSGVMHSEFNPSKDLTSKLLQIWILPNRKGHSPRYQTISYSLTLFNEWNPIVVPSYEKTSLGWINQSAWLFLSNFESGINKSYAMQNKMNGLYVFLIDGKVNLAGVSLSSRDAISFNHETRIDFHFTSPSKILLIEIPI